MTLPDLLNTTTAVALTMYLLLSVSLVLLLFRVADEAQAKPKNHMAIAGCAFLAFALVIRLGVLWTSRAPIDWSMVLGTLGLLALLLTEPKTLARVSSLWKLLTGQRRSN